MGHNPCLGEAVVNTASYTVVATAGIMFLCNISIIAKKWLKKTSILLAQKHVPFLKSMNPAISLFSWLYLPPFCSSRCFVLLWGFFFLFFCLPSREGASPLWLTSSPWSNRNQTTAWAPQRALLKGPSDGVLKKGVFSQLPSTINTNQQDDLGFCSPMPDGPWLQASLQVCALWLWQGSILK